MIDLPYSGFPRRIHAGLAACLQRDPGRVLSRYTIGINGEYAMRVSTLWATYFSLLVRVRFSVVDYSC